MGSSGRFAVSFWSARRHVPAMTGGVPDEAREFGGCFAKKLAAVPGSRRASDETAPGGLEPSDNHSLYTSATTGNDRGISPTGKTEGDEDIRPLFFFCQFYPRSELSSFSIDPLAPPPSCILEQLPVHAETQYFYFYLFIYFLFFFQIFNERSFVVCRYVILGRSFCLRMHVKP